MLGKFICCHLTIGIGFVLFHLLLFIRLATNAFPSVFILLALGLSFLSLLVFFCILTTVKATNKIVLIISWMMRAAMCTVRCVFRPVWWQFLLLGFLFGCCWHCRVDDDDVGILFVHLWKILFGIRQLRTRNDLHTRNMHEFGSVYFVKHITYNWRFTWCNSICKPNFTGKPHTNIVLSAHLSLSLGINRNCYRRAKHYRVMQLFKKCINYRCSLCWYEIRKVKSDAVWACMAFQF